MLWSDFIKCYFSLQVLSARRFDEDWRRNIVRPIPTEFRERILEDCDNGLSEQKATKKWKVGRSTIAKIKKQRRETGSIEPKILQTGPKPKRQLQCRVVSVEWEFLHATLSALTLTTS